MWREVSFAYTQVRTHASLLGSYLEQHYEGQHNLCGPLDGELCAYMCRKLSRKLPCHASTSTDGTHDESVKKSGYCVHINDSYIHLTLRRLKIPARLDGAVCRSEASVGPLLRNPFVAIRCTSRICTCKQHTSQNETFILARSRRLRRQQEACKCRKHKQVSIRSWLQAIALVVIPSRENETKIQYVYIFDGLSATRVEIHASASCHTIAFRPQTPRRRRAAHKLGQSTRPS